MTGSLADTPGIIKGHTEWSIDEVIEWTLKELGLDIRSETEESNVKDSTGDRRDLDTEQTNEEETCNSIEEAEIISRNNSNYEININNDNSKKLVDNKNQQRKVAKANVQQSFHENKITGDILSFLTLNDCKRLFMGDSKLAVNFKIAVNRLTTLDTERKKDDEALVATLDNLHHTISEKLHEYQSQYARLRLDVLEIMKKNSISNAQQSVMVQDYFERPQPSQNNHHSGYQSPISPRNHPASNSTIQRSTSSSTALANQNQNQTIVNSSGTTPNQGPTTSSSPSEPLKQLRASKEDSTEKILKNAMKKHKLNEADWRQYVLVICYGDKERILEMEEQPVIIFKSLKQQGLHPAIMLRQKGDFEEVGDLTPGGRL